MKFKIIPNPTKDWALQISQEVEVFLTENKCQIVQVDEDVSILIGGDGTILFNKDKISGAIFGIGGEKSVICQAKSNNWRMLLAKIVKKLKTEKRLALSVKINEKTVGWAINDAIVHSRRHNFVEITMKWQTIKNTFGGDGIIIATPTGASAYAYSAGGFILNRTDFVVEAVPICPYMRAANPKLIPAEAEIEITINGISDFIIDGQQIIALNEKDVVKVIGNRTIKFVVCNG